MLQVALVIALGAIIVILFRKFDLVFGKDESLSIKSPLSQQLQDQQKKREARLKRKLQLDRALERVRILKRKGEREKAEKVLLKLLSFFNRRPEIFYELGILYLENKKYKNAISTLKAAINRDSKNGFFFHALGLAYLRNKEYQKAAENFDKALHFNNKIPYRWADLAVALIELERFREAKEAIKQALEAEPHNIR